jgi:hypothetical protein
MENKFTFYRIDEDNMVEKINLIDNCFAYVSEKIVNNEDEEFSADNINYAIGGFINDNLENRGLIKDNYPEFIELVCQKLYDSLEFDSPDHEYTVDNFYNIA